MQSVQRRFGRMTATKSADNSRVAVLLKDFEDADNLFTKVGSMISRVPPPFASDARSSVANHFCLHPDYRIDKSMARCLGLHCDLPESHGG